MKMLYTANGRYIRCCTEEGTRSVIIVCEKEYEVDVQEFMLWSILNWRILREEEISSFYEKMASSSNVTIHRSWQDCVQRLLVRGLIVVGTGDTEYDALAKWVTPQQMEIIRLRTKGYQTNEIAQMQNTSLYHVNTLLDNARFIVVELCRDA